MTLNLDDTEQDTYETRKSKTELPTKRGKIQKETKGAGFGDAVKVRASYTGADQVRVSGCGLLNEDSVLHLGTWRENQNLTGKHLQTIFNTDFKVLHSLSSLEKWMIERR